MWESLRNVLTAYAAHDPVMGYVQSMNFIAAFLLLAGLKEEDAFWLMGVVPRSGRDFTRQRMTNVRTRS